MVRAPKLNNITITYITRSSEHGHSHGPTHDQPSSISASTSAITSTSSTAGDITPVQKRSKFYGHSSSPVTSIDETYSSLYGHPAATRASLMQTAQDIAQGQSPSPTARRHSFAQGRRSSDMDPPKRFDPSHSISAVDSISNEVVPPSPSSEETPLLEVETSPEHTHSHGHSHAGSMNMRAILLHVLGDALGNVGVIATGLVIWKSSWSFKYYFDPIISLVITLIIFSSALPLGQCFLTAKIIDRNKLTP